MATSPKTANPLCYIKLSMSKSLLTILFLILWSPNLAVAQSDDNVLKRRPDRPAPVEVKEIRQESRQEVRTQLQANQELGVARQVAQNHSTRLANRFKFYENRLTAIITRFQSRLDILKQEGVSVSSVQAKLDLVKDKLQDAVTQGGKAIVAFESIQSGTLVEQRTALLSAKELADEARGLFRETHELLKQALRELKTITKPALPATSPATQNAQ